MEKLLSPEQAAELLGLQRITITRRIREGKLRCVRLGKNTVRIKPSDLEAYIAERAAETPKPAPKSE